MAETNSVGLVEALTLGSTRLVARAIGINKITKKKVTYSEDQVARELEESKQQRHDTSEQGYVALAATKR